MMFWWDMMSYKMLQDVCPYLSDETWCLARCYKMSARTYQMRYKVSQDVERFLLELIRWVEMSRKMLEDLYLYWLDETWCLVRCCEMHCLYHAEKLDWTRQDLCTLLSFEETLICCQRSTLSAYNSTSQINTSCWLLLPMNLLQRLTYASHQSSIHQATGETNWVFWVWVQAASE